LIRSIIVDDEQGSLEHLEFLLNRIETVEVVKTFNSGQLALEALSGLDIDVAFLDIDMPEMDGLTLADKISDLFPSILVVFVTAYNQYAVDAFKLNALDYILKPVARDRIQETIDRISKEVKVLPQNNKISVNCFGKFGVTILETNETIKWNTTKAEEIFAYLISKVGKEVNLEDIINHVFYETDNAKKANSITRTSIYYIKNTLKKFGANNVIVSNWGTYKINTEMVECDFYKFADFIKNQTTVLLENHTQFEKILNCYSHNYLEMSTYDWSEELRISLQESFVLITLNLCEYFHSVKSYRNAETYLKKALKLSPLSFELNKLLIQTYLALNERIFALKAFDTYKRKLKEEYGEIPSQEIIGLLY
jgi:two-component system, LytTR family, response regulator